MSQDRVRCVGNVLLAQLACNVRYHGGCPWRYASSSQWVIMVVAVVPGVPRDEISTFAGGFEVCRHVLGDRDRSRLHAWGRVFY